MIHWQQYFVSNNTFEKDNNQLFFNASTTSATRSPFTVTNILRK